MAATRKPLIAGNWKMNLNHLEAIALVQKLAHALPAKYLEKVDVVVIPPFTDIRSVQTAVEGDKLAIAYGAQDLSEEDSGAFTGEISGAFLAKLGCSYVIVGHSERRTRHTESNELVGAKAKAALRHGLTPIVCIGEGLEVREAAGHVEYNVTQIKESLAGLTTEQIASSVIAYEPVWAIGTGRVAGAEDAQEVCAAVREAVRELTDAATADSVRILYGGSVSAKNVADIVAQPDVDGALVGGASLKPDDFAQLSALAAGGPMLG